MARKRITVALDADVYRYLDWQSRLAGSNIAARANILLRMVMNDELQRPLVARDFNAWKESEDKASMFVPLDRAAQ